MKRLMLLLIFVCLLFCSCSKKDTISNVNKERDIFTGCNKEEVLDQESNQFINSNLSSITIPPEVPTINYKSTEVQLLNIDMVSSNIGYAITKNFHVIRTTNGGDRWTDILKLNSIFDYDDEPALIALNKDIVYVAVYSDSGIDVYKSSSSGNKWSISSIKMNTDDATSGYGGSILMSFVNNKEGYLLSNSLPAAGLMSEALYCTIDGGEVWNFDTVNDIVGYVTGMNFDNNGNGYITSTYHGQNEISIYCRIEGKYWNNILVPLPSKYKSFSYGKDYYVDVYSPTMFFKKSQQKKLELNFCKDDIRKVYLYSSKDDGDTWIIDGESNLLMKKFCFIDEKKGYGIDEDGSVYMTYDGGITWEK